MAASSDIVKEATKTFDQYSANRFRTSRSINMPVKYLTNRRWLFDGDSADAGIKPSVATAVMGLPLARRPAADGAVRGHRPFVLSSAARIAEAASLAIASTVASV